jgi:hypothetical protein
MAHARGRIVGSVIPVSVHSISHNVMGQTASAALNRSATMALQSALVTHGNIAKNLLYAIVWHRQCGGISGEIDGRNETRS